MKLTKHKICSNIYCVDCRETVAYPNNAKVCDRCESKLVNVPQELEGFISKFSDISLKLRELLEECERYEPKTPTDIKELTSELRTVAQELSALQESTAFQYWKDTRK